MEEKRIYQKCRDCQYYGKCYIPETMKCKMYKYHFTSTKKTLEEIIKEFIYYDSFNRPFIAINAEMVQNLQKNKEYEKLFELIEKL